MSNTEKTRLNLRSLHQTKISQGGDLRKALNSLVIGLKQSYIYIFLINPQSFIKVTKLEVDFKAWFLGKPFIFKNLTSTPWTIWIVSQSCKNLLSYTKVMSYKIHSTSMHLSKEEGILFYTFKLHEGGWHAPLQHVAGLLYTCVCLWMYVLPPSRDRAGVQILLSQWPLPPCQLTCRMNLRSPPLHATLLSVLWAPGARAEHPNPRASLPVSSHSLSASLAAPPSSRTHRPGPGGTERDGCHSLITQVHWDQSQPRCPAGEATKGPSKIWSTSWVLFCADLGNRRGHRVVLSK